MGQAAIYSMEPDCEIARSELFREECHCQLDMFLDALEPQLIHVNPTLEELTTVIFSRRHELMGQLVSSFVKQAHADLIAQQFTTCPLCGKLLKARGSHPRTVEAMVGAISFERPYFYCISCQQGFYPLDMALNLSPRQKQTDIQKAACRLAAEIPYQTSDELFHELTGLCLSDHTIHDMVAEVSGQLPLLDVLPSAQQVHDQIAELAKDKTWRPIMVLAIDGA